MQRRQTRHWFPHCHLTALYMPVCYHHDGAVPLGHDRVQGLLHNGLRLGIQRRRRLVCIHTGYSRYKRHSNRVTVVDFSFSDNECLISALSNIDRANKNELRSGATVPLKRQFSSVKVFTYNEDILYLR